jgi:sugar lactone lactonase YvrE
MKSLLFRSLPVYRYFAPCALLAAAACGGGGAAVLAVSAAASTVEVDAATAPADGTHSLTFTVRAKDASGVAIPRALVVIAASGSNNVLQAPSTTDAAGVAVATLASTAAETKTITVTANGVQLAQSLTVTFVAGAVSASVSTASANPTLGVLADGHASSTIAISVKDSHGNPIAGAPVTVTASGTGNAITAAANTDSSGATTAAISSTGAGTKTITVTANGIQLTQTPAVAFIAGPASATVSTASASPSAGLVADGATNSTIRIVLKDSQGNPLSFAVATIAATGSGNIISNMPPADTNGVITASIASTHAETKTITVTTGGVALAQTPVVSFIAGPIDTSVTSMSISPPAGVTADGATSATITVAVKDRFANPIRNATVTLAASGTGNTLSTPALTNDSGLTTATLYSTVAETKHVTATAGGAALAQAAYVTFVAGPADAALSTVTVDHAIALAAGGQLIGGGLAQGSTITVVAKDANGNLVIDAAVAVSATGTGNTISTPPATSGNGTSTARLTSTGLGIKTITATVGGLLLRDSPAVRFARSVIAGLASPYSVALDGSGNLYVTELGNHSIRKLDATGWPVTSFGTHGILAGFADPHAVAVDPSGNLYVTGVTDFGNPTNQVKKFDSSGAPVTGFGANGILSGFVDPSRLAVDGLGNLYVLDYTTVRKFDSSGAPVTSFGTAGALTPNNPITSLAADASGNLYWCESISQNDSVVKKVDAKGAPLTSFDVPEFGSVDGLGVDLSGNIYLAVSNGQTIKKFTASGTRVAGFAPYVQMPTGIAVDQAGNSYVVDFGKNDIVKFDANGASVSSFGTIGKLVAWLGTAAGLALDADENLYVTDADIFGVIKLDATGTPATSFGVRGLLDGFASPAGVALDGSRNLYLADTGNGSVKKINPTGTSATNFGSGFSSPVSIAIDGSNNIYVGDNGTHSVKKLDSTGALVTGFAGSGQLTGYDHPDRLAADSAGNIYVADSAVGVIRKYGANGAQDTLFGNGGTLGPFTTLAALAVDGSGNLSVADSGNDIIRTFNSTGTPVSYLAMGGLLSGRVFLAVGKSGTTYVTTRNNLVLAF